MTSRCSELDDDRVDVGERVWSPRPSAPWCWTAAQATMTSCSRWSATAGWCCWGGVPRDARVLRRAGARSRRRLIEERGLQRRRGRGRLAGRLPGEPLRAGPVVDLDADAALGGLPAVPGLDVAQPGRCRVRRVAPEAQRRSRDQRARSASTGSISTACARRSKRSSATSSSVDPDAARARPARATAASITSATTAGLRLRRPSRCGSSSRASARWSRQLVDLQARAAHTGPRRRGRPRTSTSYAEQNARVVRDAEEYYRLDVPRPSVSSWNLRDRHMADTLDALVDAPRPRTARPGEDRRLGAQLARRRRARHADGRRPASSTSAS